MAATEPEVLDRPLPMAEVVEERSCFTCKYDHLGMYGLHECTAVGQDVVGIHAYIGNSGCDDSPDVMPTDRTMRCPGWAPKEPT